MIWKSKKVLILICLLTCLALNTMKMATDHLCIHLPCLKEYEYLPVVRRPLHVPVIVK